MVHALTESHRVLVPDGFVADLHPERGHRPRGRRLRAYVATPGRERPAGVLAESADFYRRYLAADRTVGRALRRGLFMLRTRAVFPLRYYFRSFTALERTLEKEWSEGTYLRDPTRRRLQTLLRTMPGAQIVIEEPFRLNVLQKR